VLHASRLVACALLYLVLLLSAVGPACLVCVQGPMETKKACEAAKRLLSAHRDALAVPMLDLMKVGCLGSALAGFDEGGMALWIPGCCLRAWRASFHPAPGQALFRVVGQWKPVRMFVACLKDLSGDCIIMRRPASRLAQRSPGIVNTPKARCSCVVCSATLPGIVNTHQKPAPAVRSAQQRSFH